MLHVNFVQILATVFIGKKMKNTQKSGQWNKEEQYVDLIFGLDLLLRT